MKSGIKCIELLKKKCIKGKWFQMLLLFLSFHVSEGEIYVYIYVYFEHVYVHIIHIYEAENNYVE